MFRARTTYDVYCDADGCRTRHDDIDEPEEVIFHGWTVGMYADAPDGLAGGFPGALFMLCPREVRNAIASIGKEPRGLAEVISHPTRG